MSCIKDQFQLLTLVMHAQYDHYEAIANHSRKTWMNRKHDDARAYFYQGGQSLKDHKLEGDRIVLNCEDHYNKISPQFVSTIKMLDACEFSLNHFDFKYLLRTSNSSYVNQKALVEFTNNLPADFSYGGMVNLREGHLMCAGHAILLSRSFVKKIVNHRELILNYNLLDDRALAEFAAQHKITPIDFRQDNYTRWLLSVDHIKQQKTLPFITRCKPRPNPSSSQQWVDHVCDLFDEVEKRLDGA